MSADASRSSLYYVAESTYGTTPASPAFQTLRHNGTTLALAKGALVSEELRSDRQIADFRHGSRQVGGAVTCEVSYGTLDDLLEALLQGTWSSDITHTEDTVSFANSDNSLNTVEANFPAFYVGQVINISGAGEQSNGGEAIVVSRTDSKIVVSGITLADEAAGATVTIASKSTRLQPGSTRRSFSFLRRFEDLDSGDKPFHIFTGVELNTLALTLSAEQIPVAEFGVLGQNATAPATAAPSGTTYTAANANSVVDAFTGTVKEGGTTIGIVTELTLNAENGMAPRMVVGQNHGLQASNGRFNLTGQVVLYFEDAAMLSKFYDATESSLQFTLTDEDGNWLRVTIPRVSYTGGQPDTTGQGPITLTMPFQALRDATTGTTVTVERYAA